MCVRVYIYIYIYRTIGLMGRVFTNCLGDRGSIIGRVIPKTKKLKGLVRSPKIVIGLVAIEEGAFASPSTKVVNFTFFA